MVVISLDSPSCGVCLFDPRTGGCIGMLPDRPRIVPFEVRLSWCCFYGDGLRTWAGIIQVVLPHPTSTVCCIALPRESPRELVRACVLVCLLCIASASLLYLKGTRTWPLGPRQVDPTILIVHCFRVLFPIERRACNHIEFRRTTLDSLRVVLRT